MSFASVSRLAFRCASSQRPSAFLRRGLVICASAPSRSFSSTASESWAFVGAISAATVAVALCSTDRATRLDARLPSGGDLPGLSSGTPVKEPSTGILFPLLCNGYYFVGCGVRIKYMFVKVYAVGTYMDPLAMSAIKNSTREAIEGALLDPTYPRTIRIVMARGLPMDKYLSAIVEAVEPRMMGKDLDKLEEFKAMNPKIDLVEGAEMELTIRGDTLLYKNAMGGVGTIRSLVFTKALCEVYYGRDPASQPHKDAVLAGIPKL